MQVVLNRSGVAELLRPSEFTRFDAVLSRAAKAVPTTLVPDGEMHVWVEEAWLRGELMKANPVPDWQQKYEGMLAYARSKRWVREAPMAIRAHVSWVD